MALKLIQAPSEEPLVLADVKQHLRVDFPDDDAQIQALITAARQYVEEVGACRSLITQQWRLSLDRFPDSKYWDHNRRMYPFQDYYHPNHYGYIYLPMPPVQSVDSFTYVDVNGTTQTLTKDTDYLLDLDSEPARITPAPGLYWPPVQERMNAIQITFTAGYGTHTDVPGAIKQAMLMLVAHLYNNREATAEKALQEVPFAVDALLSTYRAWRFA